MLTNLIRKFLLNLKFKNIKSLTYDDIRIVPLMRYNVKNHKLVRRVYESFYDIFLSVNCLPEGPSVELGTGYGFLKEYSKKNIICSDINSDFNIDIKFSAESIPFRNNSVSAYFMFGVLHHIKDVESMLSEINRTLKLHGRIIMIEPYNSIWARFLYRISHSEPFKPDAGWHIEGNRPLSDANLALPWIIFFKDRKAFELKYTRLKINRLQLHNSMLFQLSGAGAYNTFLPGFLYPVITFFEKLLKPFYKYLAMFVTIELEKI